MTLGHWLVVAAFVLAILVPALLALLKAPKTDTPCECARTAAGSGNTTRQNSE